MAALGQKRRTDRVPATSGLPPINRHLQRASACLKGAKLGSDGLSFRIFNALRGRAFFPDRQREAHCSQTSRSAAAP